MGMYSKAAIKGHAIHPILIAFPVTFYSLAPTALAVYQWISHTAFWYQLACFSVLAGIATAIVAAVPGTIDWVFGIPRNTAAWKRGLIHMILNVIALCLFIATALVMHNDRGTLPNSVLLELGLTLLAMALTGVAGWHGGELIATHKVGVRMNQQQMFYEKTLVMNPEAHGK